MGDHTWLIEENEFSLNDNQRYETLFALGNGTLGTRGTFVEGLPQGNREGNFVNGFFESEKISYGEKFIGYPESGQTMLNVANPKLIRLTIGDEPFHLLHGRILAYKRVLNMREGILYRHLRWESPAGRQIELTTERMVCLQHRYRAAIRWTLTPLNFSGPLTILSAIDAHPATAEKSGVHDPRLGAGFNNNVLPVKGMALDTNGVIVRQQTETTGFDLITGIASELQGAKARLSQIGRDLLFGQQFDVEAQEGQALTLTKIIVMASLRPGVSSAVADFVDHALAQTEFVSQHVDTPPESEFSELFDADDGSSGGGIRINSGGERRQFAALADFAARELKEGTQSGYDSLKQEQIAAWKAYWERTDVEIEGDDHLQRGIRLNLFHLYQSTGRDGYTNIAAKGLTGEGYEGHYFWDTETYVLPFFLFNNPLISRKLLEYRYHTLPQARQRAREMAHQQGALYPWRTIDGREVSPYFPAGTAQYHINGDIALAVKRYHQATADDQFIIDCGLEILVETARLWVDAGHFDSHHGGRFCIDAVTGPDEYTAIVNNNAYTNLMARENLRFAAEKLAWLEDNHSEAFQSLKERIGLQVDEAALWLQAADKMYIPYDEKRGLIAQDDTFLQKAVWDFENTPADHHPLLLYYHPLILYRYQVCKQADTVLAEFLLHDQFSLAQKRRDFDHYEPLTTHDSSLSACIFGIMAAELGYADKSYSFFADSAIADLEDKKGNTKDGIHAANMGGSWQSIVFGFAGMRVGHTLSFKPQLPAHWQAYRFKITYQGRILAVEVNQQGCDVTLLSGPPLAIEVDGRTVNLA